MYGYRKICSIFYTATGDLDNVISPWQSFWVWWWIKTAIRTVRVLVVYCIFSFWFHAFKHLSWASNFINLVGIVVFLWTCLSKLCELFLRCMGVVIIIIIMVWFAVFVWFFEVPCHLSCCFWQFWSMVWLTCRYRQL